MVPDGGTARLRQAVQGLLFALVVCAPLPLGGARPWAVAGLELWIALLGTLTAILLLRDPRPLRDIPRGIVLPGLLLLVLGVVQLIPLPHLLAGWLSPRTLEIRNQVGPFLGSLVPEAAPLSLAPADSFDALLRLVAYAIVALAALVALRTHEQIRRLALVVVASAAFQGVYGSFEFLSGRQHILGFAKQYYLDEATGTFVNRNHFAGFLAMALPLALGLLVLLSRESAGQPADPGWRERIRRFIEERRGAGMVAFVAAASVWVGILLSQSRAGLVAALAGTAIFALQHPPRRRLLALSALLLPLAWLLLLDIQAPGSRFDELGTHLASSAGRPPVWRATLDMTADHPWLGTGYGTFEAAFPGYRPPGIRHHWSYAHNDWLEAAATGGLLAPLLLLALLVCVLRLGGGIRPSRDRRAATVLLSSCKAGVVVVALHSLVDFQLRIPANAILLATLLGTAVAAAAIGAGPRSAPPVASRWNRVVPVLLLCVVLLCAATGWESFRAQARPATDPQDSWRWIIGPSAGVLNVQAQRSIQLGLSKLQRSDGDPAQRMEAYRAELQQAEYWLVRSLRAQPAQAQTLARLASVRWELGTAGGSTDPRPILQMVELASRLSPQVPRLQLQLGRLLLALARPHEAAMYFRRAVELDVDLAGQAVERLFAGGVSAATILDTLPRNAEVLVALLPVFQREGSLPRYLAELELAWSSDPSLASAELLRAYGRGCLDSAAEARLADQLGRMGPLPLAEAEAQRLRQLARARLRQGRPDEALADARRAAELQPDSPVLVEFLGDVQLASGQAAAAAGSFRETLRQLALADGGPAWRSRLYRKVGQAEQGRGEMARAYDAFRLALQLDPDEPIAKARLAEMEREAGIRR